jgi:hypothetical protein
MSTIKTVKDQVADLPKEIEGMVSLIAVQMSVLPTAEEAVEKDVAAFIKSLEVMTTKLRRSIESLLSKPKMAEHLDQSEPSQDPITVVQNLMVRLKLLKRGVNLAEVLNQLEALPTSDPTGEPINKPTEAIIPHHGPEEGSPCRDRIRPSD